MMPCPTDDRQQGEEEFISVGMDFYLIILERECQTLIRKQSNQGAMLLGDVKVLLFGKLQHRTFGEHIKTPLTDESFLPGILSEEKIKHDTCYRNK